MFACAIIKECRYWPAYVPGKAINAKFTELGKGVGDWLVISGKLSGEDYFLWALKEPSYVMKMMAMGGPLLPNESCGELKWVWMEDGIQCLCRYMFPSLYDWHCKFHHAIDDHNNL